MKLVYKDVGIEYLLDVYSLEQEGIKEPMKLSLLNECFESDSYRFKAIFDEDEGVMLGYLIYMVSLDFFDIVQIVTRKEFQRMGIASHMLQCLIDEKENKTIFLEVRESNIKAQKLYEKFGFVQYNVRKKYYDDGENALLLRKD